MSTLTARRPVVLMGGRSTEHDASLHSYNHLAEALASAGRLSAWSVAYLTPRGEATWHRTAPATARTDDIVRGESLDRLTLLRRLSGAPHVFSLLYGTEGEDGAWQGVAEVLDLRGNFGAPAAAVLGMHKLAFGAWVKAMRFDVDVPETWPVRTDDTDAGVLDDLVAELGGRPCIVKPNAMGASLLTTRIAAPRGSSLAAEIRRIAPYDELALVQRFVEGDEYTVGVFEDEAGPTALPVLRARIDAPFLGHREKHSKGAIIAEALTSSWQAERLQSVSLGMHRALGLRLWSRFDFIWPHECDRPVALEVNTMPGLMRGSAYPRMLELSGRALPDLLDASCRLAPTPRVKELRYDIAY